MQDRIWTFLDYISASGRNVIREWMENDLSKRALAAFDARIAYLAITERKDWHYPEFKMLRGKHREIGEIRFKVDKQYRPLGFFGPREGQFTLLIGATKKGKIWDPRDALDTALSRRAEVLADPSRVEVHDG